MSFALFLANNLHLSIGEEFCTFPCQKFAPSFLLSWLALNSDLPLPKTFCSSEQFAFLRKIRTVKWRDKGSTWSSKTNDRISGCIVLLLIEKMNQINTKNYWKEIVREVTLGGIDTTWENLHKAQIRKAFFPLTGLIFAFRSADFLRWCLFPERNLTHNLFFYFQ